VVLTARNLEKAKLAAAELGSQVMAAELEVSDLLSAKALAHDLEKKFKKVDVLINNAGIIGNKPATAFDLLEIKQVFETNFFGIITTTKALMPLLQKSPEGRIINLSSGMGAWADLTGGYAGYRLSKTALNAFTVLLANELATTGIKVNAMCPGWVKTEMGGASAPRSVSQGADTAVWLATEKQIPTGKFFRDRKPINW
jgi:NAD(P)-dependent dehydrogenase (short-subunit alcohol dehydrogenase family)